MGGWICGHCEGQVGTVGRLGRWIVGLFWLLVLVRGG